MEKPSLVGTLGNLKGDEQVQCLIMQSTKIGFVMMYECTCMSITKEDNSYVTRPCEKHASLGPFRVKPWWEKDPV